MEALIALEQEGGLLHGHLHWLVVLLEGSAMIIDLCAIALLLVGAVRFIVGCTIAEVFRLGSERVNKTNRERIELGRYILAGLELFIVSDVIHTALSLAFADLLFLLLLVVIRSMISFFLERELAQLRSELDG